MFKTGNSIKLKSDIFAGSDSLTDTFGDLGYPGIFRHCVFEVVKELDDGRGKGVLVTLTNADKLKNYVPGVKEIKAEGEWFLLLKDVEKANLKITLDYEFAENPDNEQTTRELFEERKRLRSLGKDKRNKDMRENWRKIQVARGEIAGSGNSEKIKVLLPKQRMEIMVDRTQIPKSGDEKAEKGFKELLVSEIVRFRKDRKSDKIETKSIHGKTLTRLGHVHTKDSEIFEAFKSLIKNAFETEKTPTDKKANYVGIEIELIYSGNMQKFKELMFAERLHKHVTITADGSLRACHNVNNYSTLELQVLARSAEVKRVLESLQKVFDDPAVDAYANGSCGLHVHLDMRNRDHKLAYKNLVRIQNILRGSQPVRRVKNHHCKANTSDDFKASEGESRGNRYWVINPDAYEDHTTLEVRIHEGTTDCSNIYNWVMLLETVVNQTKEIPVNKFTLAGQLEENLKIGIPVDSIEYVDKRIKKFRSLATGA